MDRVNFFLVALLLVMGILSVIGFFELASQPMDLALFFSNLFGLNEAELMAAESLNIECDSGNECTGSPSVPVVIWLFCCIIVGLAGYRRRQVKT